MANYLKQLSRFISGKVMTWSVHVKGSMIGPWSRESASGSKKAPVTPPSCRRKRKLPIIWSTKYLPFAEMVGAWVRPSRTNENKSGSLSPRAVHRAFTTEVPSSWFFSVSTTRLGMIWSGHCCRRTLDSSSGIGLRAFLSWTTVLNSFIHPWIIRCFPSPFLHFSSFMLISLQPPSIRAVSSHASTKLTSVVSSRLEKHVACMAESWTKEHVEETGTTDRCELERKNIVVGVVAWTVDTASR